MINGLEYVRSNSLVYVADDNPVNLELICSVLGREPIDVAVASDGQMVLAMVEEELPDLILLDVMMPGLDGFETCRRLKADAATRDIAVIFMTSMAETGYRVKGLQLGAVDYITKPFEEEELLARVRTHLSLRRMTRALQLQNARLEEELRRNAVLQKKLEHEKAELLKVNQELSRSREQTAEVFGTLSEILPGKVLDGKYRIEAIIGSGGFGIVYRATQLSLERRVALKVIYPHHSLSSNELLTFIRAEGISASRVNHPNAVVVFDSNSVGGLSYLAMELLEGRTLLAEVLEKQTLPFERCARIILPVCEVLAYAHSLGIIHCDIKPGNIYLHRGRAGEIVKVLDFGIARLTGQDGLANQDELDAPLKLVGTPSYMAPERLRGEPFDGRVDVYSVAMMVVSLLCGMAPATEDQTAAAMRGQRSACTQDELRELCPDMPDWAALALENALNLTPAQRPTMEQFLKAWSQGIQTDLNTRRPEAERRYGTDGAAAQTDEGEQAYAKEYDEPTAPIWKTSPISGGRS